MLAGGRVALDTRLGAAPGPKQTRSAFLGRFCGATSVLAITKGCNRPAPSPAIVPMLAAALGRRGLQLWRLTDGSIRTMRHRCGSTGRAEVLVADL